MKSNKLLLVNGAASIVGGLLILYVSSKRWHWEIIYLVPTLVENSDWGDLVLLISFLFAGLSIVGMVYYGEDSRVNKTGHKLLFYASIIGLIPFLSIFSCLLALISGSFYLQDVPKFKSDDKAD
ncbi:insulin activator factor [Streptococcus sanguinis]|uniref:insulin activator factor n=1 Tax=Streptococcus sanguinis TaxID=1305 RepID=UPI0022838ACE|nr:insulin activator factor [Streptococcus sanguinis]MCY7023391.1 insulin activator factor [Streptococcus sanguinis]